jgi:phosphatidylglycerophosphate synthase
MAETRENLGLLANAERRVLLWLAVRIPRAVNADHLTATAVAGILLAAAGFWIGGTHREALLLVIVGLAVNWFGDSLDGTVARVRNQQRPRYGYYVDHVLDSAGTLALFCGMALGGFMTPVVALATVAAYYLVSIEVYLATHALGRFRMSYWGIGPTELRLVLCAGAIVLMNDSYVSPFGKSVLLFDVGGAVGAVGLIVTAARSAIANGRELYRAEPMGEGRFDTLGPRPGKRIQSSP